MSNARKFAFETEFAPDGAILREASKRLTPEEIETQCALFYERGKLDAFAEAERETAAALQALADAASAVLTRLDSESRAMREEAAHIALVAAKKIAGAALDHFGAERAASIVEATMEALRHQPRLLVKLSSEAAETLRPRIAQMCETHAYAAAVLVRAEEGLRAGEVVIDWSDGVVVSNPNDAAEHIHALIEAALSAADPSHKDPT